MTQPNRNYHFFLRRTVLQQKLRAWERVQQKNTHDRVGRFVVERLPLGEAVASDIAGDGSHAAQVGRAIGAQQRLYAQLHLFRVFWNIEK